MSYLSESETGVYILEMIDLFKQKKHNEVINLIKERNIDPQYSENIISDYAAIWLVEPDIIDFFENIKKIGGEPANHHSMLNNCIAYNKIDTCKWLINEGILDKCKDDIVYFINIAVMEKNLKAVQLLERSVDITQYKLNGETNPSFLNRIIHKEVKQMLNYFVKSGKAQPFMLTQETAGLLEQDFVSQEFKKFFIKKTLKAFKIKDEKKYLSNEYKEGDIFSIFKVIEYEVLNKSLSRKETLTKKPSKI